MISMKHPTIPKAYLKVAGVAGRSVQIKISGFRRRSAISVTISRYDQQVRSAGTISGQWTGQRLGPRLRPGLDSVLDNTLDNTRTVPWTSSDQYYNKLISAL